MIVSIFPSKPSRLLTIHSLMDVDHDCAFNLIEDVPNCLMWYCTKFLWALAKYGVEYFAQSAIDPYLELIKA